MGGRSSVVDGTVERVGNGTVKIRLLCTALRTSETASEEGRAMSAHPSKSHPSIHCLVHSPLPEIAGWDGQPVQKASPSSSLSKSKQISAQQIKVSSIRRLSGNLAVSPCHGWMFGSLDVRLHLSCVVSPALLSPLAPFDVCVFLWPISDRFNWRRQEIPSRSRADAVQSEN